MTPTDATLQMLHISTQIATPILLAVLGAGLAIGLLQAIFQLQEPTLGLVARILALGFVLQALGVAMLEKLVDAGVLFFLSIGLR